MTPADMPLTVIQSERDPEWHGLMRRFWATTLRRDECEHCGEVFTVPHNARTAHQRYCSPRCRCSAGTRRYTAAQREKGRAA